MSYARQILAALFNWRMLLSVATSLALIGLFLGIVAASGHTVNLETLSGAIRNMPASLLWAYLGIQLIGTVFRAQRYQLLIRAAGETNVPHFGHMYLVTMIRNMVVDMLPARLGELLFIAMLNRGYNVRANACISSLSLSIVLDVAILVPVLLLLSAIPLANAAMQQGMLPIALVVVLAVGVVLALMFPVLTFVTSMLKKWSEAKTSVWLQKFAGFVSEVHDAFEETRRHRILGRALLLTAGVRIAKYSALYCLFVAVTTPTMASLQSLAPWEVLSTLISSEAMASVPLPTFMSFGSYEAGGLMALTMLGYPAIDSAIALLAMHISSQSIDYFLGGVGIILFYFTASNIRMTSITASAPNRPWLTLASLLAVAGALALLVNQYGQFKASRYIVPPSSGSAATATAEQRKARDATSDLDGFIVWSSNRYGNHDIMKLSLPDWTLTRVTKHPNSEYFPRISPNGKQLVFSRGKKPWVSHAEPESWDVILLDLKSGKERMLARSGNTPTWSEDGSKVYFQRDIEKFVEIDVKSGKERVLFKSGTRRIPEGVVLQTPNYSNVRNQMAVSFRGTRRLTVLVHYPEGIKRQIGYGCQLTWSPKSDYLYWVDERGGGRMKNHVLRLDIQSKKQQVWLDLPGDYSHEYFPKVSNTGEYMVLGASAGGHAHDSADYEMFLWKIGSAASEAVRISYHTGNDNWPDIYLRK